MRLSLKIDLTLIDLDKDVKLPIYATCGWEGIHSANEIADALINASDNLRNKAKEYQAMERKLVEILAA